MLSIIDGHLDLADRDAGQQRGLLIAADGEDVATPARPAKGKAEDQGEDGEEDEGRPNLTRRFNPSSPSSSSSLSPMSCFLSTNEAGSTWISGS